VAHETRERFDEIQELDWRGVLADQEEWARELIRAHPVVAVAASAALGFLIARLLREESS
jgi:hypothetical protein